MKKVRENAFFIIFAYFALFQSLTSTWAVQALNIPQSLSRAFTMLVYLPFLVAICNKLVQDVLNIKRTFSAVSNWIYYSFVLYYLGLCVYRFANGMEVKENLYYSIVFFGAIAVYMLLRDGKIFMTRKQLDKNLLWIAAFFELYRLAYVLIGAQIFAKSPININLTSGIVALLLPFVANMLIDRSRDKKEFWLPWMVFCGGLVVIATTGARALFALTAVNVAVMLVVALIRRRGVLRIVMAAVLGCAIVVSLAVANVGQVRYALYRQTGVDLSAVSGSFETKPSTTAKPTTEPEGTKAPVTATDPTNAPEAQPTDKDQLKAQNQIDASDYMRKKLVQHGIEQIKENPLFGNGDVLYRYRLKGNYAPMQSSHNFIIEAVVCYGAIGLVMIAALFITLLVEAKLFERSALRRWNYKVTMLLTIGFYFALGFVQPTVFDVFICPLFVLTVAACSKALRETQ